MPNHLSFKGSSTRKHELLLGLTYAGASLPRAGEGAGRVEALEDIRHGRANGEGDDLGGGVELSEYEMLAVVVTRYRHTKVPWAHVRQYVGWAGRVQALKFSMKAPELLGELMNTSP